MNTSVFGCGSTRTMSHALHHAMGSVKKYGGKVRTTCMSRMVRCSKRASPAFAIECSGITARIKLMCEIFGPSLTNSDGETIPTQWIGNNTCSRTSVSYRLRNWISRWLRRNHGWYETQSRASTTNSMKRIQTRLHSTEPLMKDYPNMRYCI